MYHIIYIYICMYVCMYIYIYVCVRVYFWLRPVFLGEMEGLVFDLDFRLRPCWGDRGSRYQPV